MFERIAKSIELARTSWALLMDDRKLLVFPALSGVITLLVVVSFILPIILTGNSGILSTAGPVASLVLLFFFYLISYFIVIFFNVGLISCVKARLEQKEMTVQEGLSYATRNLGSIIAWAIIAATVGLILRVLEDRAGFAGQIAAAVAGGAWSLVTLFVVPVMIFERKGVFSSVKESFSLFRKTWGESVVGGISIAVIFVAAGAVGVLLLIGAFLTRNPVVIGIAIGGFILYIAVLGVLYAAMQGVFIVTLYTYAKTGSVPAVFRKDLIESAFVRRNQRSGPGTT
jgi:membrane-anchored glycerophosphoryl diester phosphodiesterase (GDPDase)